MKRYVHAADNTEVEIKLSSIECIVLVEDATDYSPKDRFIAASSSANKLDYSSLTRDQLLKLPKRELEKIHNVNVLRKLKKDELTPAQQIEVAKANAENFTSSIAQVKEALNALKQCAGVFVIPTSKNVSFMRKIFELGGSIDNSDVRKIVNQLHVKDYSYSTYSYLDFNWCSMLMVLDYNGSYAFRALREGDDHVVVDSMKVYIKIDVDVETQKGYAAMSFHEPEFKLSHPYESYPVDKEDI